MMNQREVTSILLAGVGGQGILKASDIMCEVLMAAGCDVKKSEVHGMAQRGGCVTSHVRYGDKVYSPIEKAGSVNVLLSFEKMEVLRYLRYLNAESAIIVNSEKINPPAVNIGSSPYPVDFVGNLQKKFRLVHEIDATTLAKKAGNIKTSNIVLLGALSKLMDIDRRIWLKIIENSFPEKLIKMNIGAFQMGINA